jgi:fatty-acyl-CoA synthase
MATGSSNQRNSTRTAKRWSEYTLGQALAECVENWGDKELIVFPTQRMIARQFAAEVDHFACGLIALGVRRGDHIAAWLPNLPELCVLELAMAKLGCTMVAFNTRYRSSELEYVLRHSDASTLMTVPEHSKIDFSRILRHVLPELANSLPNEVKCAAAPELRRVITLGASGDGMISYQEVMELGKAPGLTEVLRRSEAEVHCEDVVLMQYTSGTTAFPKAAMLCHGQVLRNAAQMGERAGIDESDRLLSAMPMFHVGGSVCALLGAITLGYTLYLDPVFDASRTLDVIEREAITTYVGLESMFISLRNHPDFTKRSRSSLHKGWTAGTSSLLRMVAEEIGIKRICPLYGLSEGSPNVTIADWRDPYEKRLNTMGRPQPDVEVRILSTETGETVPIGQVGEICFRGYNVMKGYYKDSEGTARAIDAEGWLHTGDLGRMDSDGYLTWTGRLKDTLRVGGENISALEVENLLGGHPAVQSAIVIGVPDDRLGEVPFAYIQLKAAQKVTPEEIIAYCKERVSGFKVPKHVRFVEQFPMTGSGKIQKYEMKKGALAELATPGKEIC